MISNPYIETDNLSIEKIKINYIQDSTAFEVTCRICRDCEPCNDLIAPCSCIGSIEYVHRSCLDKWRSTSETRFRECEICKFVYEMEDIQDSDKLLNKRLLKYKCLVMCDILWFIICQQALVLILTGFTSLIPGISEKLHIDNHFVASYIAGWIGFFGIIGLVGVFIGCTESRENESGSGTVICCFGDCNSNDFFLVILSMIVIIIVFGIFIGIWKFLVYCYQIQQNRQTRIYRYEETVVHRVKDKSLFITV